MPKNFSEFSTRTARMNALPIDSPGFDIFSLLPNSQTTSSHSFELSPRALDLYCRFHSASPTNHCRSSGDQFRKTSKPTSNTSIYMDSRRLDIVPHHDRRYWNYDTSHGAGVPWAYPSSLRSHRPAVKCPCLPCKLKRDDYWRGR